MCKNRIDPDRPQMTVRYGAEKILFACGISDARAERRRNTVFNICFFYSSMKYFVAL